MFNGYKYSSLGEAAREYLNERKRLASLIRDVRKDLYGPW